MKERTEDVNTDTRTRAHTTHLGICTAVNSVGVTVAGIAGALGIGVAVTGVIGDVVSAFIRQHQ